MKILLPLLFFASTHYCLAQTDTNLIAAGNWSEPVSDGKGNDMATLRGRLLVYAPYDSKSESKTNLFQWYPQARVYLELQHLKPEHAWSAPVEIYYNPGFDSYTSDEHDGGFKNQKDASGVVTNVTFLKFLRDATGGITNTTEDASSIIHHQASLHLQMCDANDKPYSNECTMINGSFPASYWVTLPCDTTMRLRADIYTLADSKKADGGMEIFVNGGSCTIPPHTTNDYYLCGTFSPPTNHPSPLNYHVWQGTLNLPRVKIPSR